MGLAEISSSSTSLIDDIRKGSHQCTRWIFKLNSKEWQCPFPRSCADLKLFHGRIDGRWLGMKIIVGAALDKMAYNDR